MGQNWKSLEPVDVKLLENAEDISQKKGKSAKPILKDDKM